MKLKPYGIEGGSVEIIHFYLNRRKQCVKIDGQFSKFFVVTDIVPQILF
jgi:hypothetical protein